MSEKELREWERGTRLVMLFIHTAFVENGKPQSLMLVSEPGNGKTEMLERFRANPYLSFHSDLTVKQLWPLVRHTGTGKITFIVFTEFQKLFQRKDATAMNCIGTLAQYIEEGVQTVSVGPKSEDYGGARGAIIAAMTNGTLAKYAELLDEMGFLDRTAVIPWHLPPEELDRIMDRIAVGDMRDLTPVHIPQPRRKVKVRVQLRVAREIKQYALQICAKRSPLRVYNRFMALVRAAAVMRGARVATWQDWLTLYSFRSYWDRMKVRSHQVTEEEPLDAANRARKVPKKSLSVGQVMNYGRRKTDAGKNGKAKPLVKRVTKKGGKAR